MPSTAQTVLHVVLYEDEGLVIAQCLEYDFGGEGATEEAAIASLKNLYVGYHVVARHLKQEPFAGHPPAPQEFWKMWDERRAAGKSARVISLPPLPDRLASQAAFTEAQLLCA